VFYRAELIENARRNAREHPWAARMVQPIVEAAQPWMTLSDEALWSLMFGPTIKRSWMVWSNGYCPACRESVPMYSWEIAALQQPWKVRCPHCREFFPKNDFARFYASGLDEHGVFDPERADRALLYNAEHPDPSDPRRRFGVDDGDGYVEGEHRWRFIGAYLIYGQWKQAVHGGIKNLAAAYVVTGDPAYAQKAGILLDRVADLYPTFDFGKEGVMYEGPPRSGYVSTWHDACEETRELALAYDQVAEALQEESSRRVWGTPADGVPRGEMELVAFLRQKAVQYQLANPKACYADIRRNIEDRILRDALNSRDKIYSNYPQTEIAVAVINSILGGRENRDAVMADLDAVIEKATAVDGLTGEKGLAGYTANTARGLALLLAEYARSDPGFLKELIARHPRLHAMFRFHLDTWCLGRYYPQIGDTGSFAQPVDQYVGVSFSKNPGVKPSMYTFLWQLYEATGDVAFVQVLYGANGGSVEGLPHDLFAADPDAFQEGVRETVSRWGAEPDVGSVNLQEWHLAILRAGRGPHARALWLDYDAGGAHGHRDGLNLGLFAKGLDLMPDFGYPPVQYGGWAAPRAVWYTMTAAHNTVVVDGQNQRVGAGKTTLWANGQQLQAIRASAPALIEGQQYERTVVMVAISERDFYLVDIFRVVGGTDHAKFMHSHFGDVTTHALSLQPAAGYGFDTQMRHFRRDAAPQPGWSVDWKIADQSSRRVWGTPADGVPRGEILGLRNPGAEVHLRYTDLTTSAQAATCEGWVSTGQTEEAWIPRVMVRRQGVDSPLASTFVSLIEPYERRSNITGIRRLSLQTAHGGLYPASSVAVEIHVADGRQDLIIAADAENPLGLSPSLSADRVLVQEEWGVRLEGELCLVRRDATGAVRPIALCRGRAVAVGDVALTLQDGAEFIEISSLRGGGPR
jgi:hypothetical protein